MSQEKQKAGGVKGQAKMPNKRHQRLIAELADPNNKSVAAAGRRAGFSKAVTRSKIYHIANRPEIVAAVKERIDRALAHHKVTPEEIVGSAVRQMRSSMDDVLDETGSFSLDKARETGAVDFIKKHKKTTKTVYDPATGQTITTMTVEVEMLTNQDGRKEVADYVGLSKGQWVNVNVNVEQSPTEKAITLFSKMIDDKSVFDGRDTMTVLGQFLDYVLKRNEGADELEVTKEAERIAEIKLLGNGE